MPACKRGLLERLSAMNSARATAQPIELVATSAPSANQMVAPIAHAETKANPPKAWGALSKY